MADPKRTYSDKPGKPGFSFPGPVPKEALAYFRAKGWAVGFDHRDVWREEHAVAFTVAKAMNVEVLETIRAEVDRAIADGITFRQFAASLEPRLQGLGWWGVKEMTDPKTGEVREVQLGSPRRLEIIYRTNLKTARAAGQWQRIERTKTALPYLLYQLGPSRVHRDDHARWAGTLLPVDDPFWATHAPPNGWGCKCGVRQIGRREAASLGGPTPRPPVTTREWVNERTGEVTRVPDGITPGFDYNPGRARLRAFTPPPAGGLPTSFPPGVEVPPLPPAREVPSSRLVAEGLTEEEYAAAFLREFGATMDRGSVHVDPVGEPLVITQDLFRDRATGELKVFKGKRRRRLLLVADALKDPDEIWWIWEPQKKRVEDEPARYLLRRRYLARWQVEGESVPGLVVFDYSAEGWRGVTAFAPDSTKPERQDAYLRGQRVGLLAYRRK